MPKIVSQFRIKYQWWPILFVILGGIVLAFFVHASGRFMSLQPEAGRANCIKTETDSSASAGTLIRFGHAGSEFGLANCRLNDKGQVSLFWNQSSVSDLSSYEIWRNGSKIGTLPAASVSSHLVGNSVATGPDLFFLHLSPTEVATSNQILDGIKSNGFGYVRLDFYWSVIQRDGRGSIDWAPLDSAVDRIHAQGLKVLPILAYTPDWALPPGGIPQKTPPADMADYVTFAKNMVARYGSTSWIPRYHANPVTTWEIWNEPNNHQFWKDSGSYPYPKASSYAAMLRAVYPGIKSVDPNATVLTGGLSPGSDEPDHTFISPATFLRQLYASGAGGYFDAFSIHPYSSSASPTDPASWNTYMQITTLHNIMASNGDGDKKIWGTEGGWGVGTCSGCVNAQLQAYYSVQAVYDWWSWSYVGPFTFWIYRDAGTDPTRQFDTYGFVDQNFVAKPSLAAIKIVNNQLVYTDTDVPNHGNFTYTVKAVATNGATLSTNSLTISKP